MACLTTEWPTAVTAFGPSHYSSYRTLELKSSVKSGGQIRSVGLPLLHTATGELLQSVETLYAYVILGSISQVDIVRTTSTATICLSAILPRR